MDVLVGVLGLVALGVAVPLLYYLRRTVGKSFVWRFRPGWSRLTRAAAMERFPGVDAAGRRLVYEAIPESRFQLRVRELSTGHERVVAPPGCDARHPVVSADGRRVAYEQILARTPRRRSRLVVHDLDTGAERVFGEGFDHVLGGALDRTGERVLVCGATNGERKVRLCAEDDAVGRLLLPGRGEEVSPALCDDGTLAAFLTNDRHHPRRRFDPAVAELRTGAVRCLAEPRAARGLVMSADGTRLAWEAVGDGPSEVRVLDRPALRVASLGPGLAPALSADGRFVAFERIGDAFDLVVVDLVAGREAVLSRGNPYPHQPVFRRDRPALVVVLGHLNPLSRTGDCDLFELDLERAGRRAWTACTPTWTAAAFSAPRGGHTAPLAPWSAPPNSLWVAAWYFRADGTMASMAEQDGDGIEVYSARLATAIDRVRALTGAPRVHVVCHCMGGLVAMGAVQYWHDGEHGFRGPSGLPAHAAVQRLVTVASPLRGNSLFGVMRLLRALRLPYYRTGFTRQAHDLTRGSEFLHRVNRGARWRERIPGDPASGYKPEGRAAPPYYHSLTGNGLLVMDGAVPTTATRCTGLPGSPTHLAADEHAVLYEQPDGRCSTTGGRRLVHVPEDAVGDQVAEDKSRALTDWIRTRLEPGLPILFVHGSYLFRGLPDLSWRVQLHRLAGEVPGQPASHVRVDTGPDGEDLFWLLDAGAAP